MKNETSVGSKKLEAVLLAVLGKSVALLVKKYHLLSALYRKLDIVEKNKVFLIKETNQL